MLREVANAVFVTFLGSEWLCADDGAGPSSLLRRPAARRAAAAAAAVNVVCALAPGAGDLAQVCLAGRIGDRSRLGRQTCRRSKVPPTDQPPHLLSGA